MFSLGCHFRQVSAALYGSCPAVDGAKLPCYRHPQGNDSGGASLTLPAVQGLPEGL